MTNVFARTNVGGRPVIYAGRFLDQTLDADLPNGCLVLGQHDVLSRELTRLPERTSTLVILDLPSFTFEAMTDDSWDVPIIVVLPSDLDAESLTTAFGTSLFEHLEFFDRIVAPDCATWRELRKKYRWAESQRFPVSGDKPGDAIEAVRALLEGMPAASAIADGADRDPRFDKAIHRVQAAALEARLAAVRTERGVDTPLEVLEVGAGVGRWVPSFDPMKTRFVGIEAREDLVEIARADFPGQRFDSLGPDLLLPYEDESFDLTFSVMFMHHHPTRAKRVLLSEMWRVTRPSGRLLFLETFVFAGREEKDVYPTSVTEFAVLILGATSGKVVLEHIGALKYPREEMYRGGLILLRRLGVPKAYRSSKSTAQGHQSLSSS